MSNWEEPMPMTDDPWPASDLAGARRKELLPGRTWPQVALDGLPTLLGDLLRSTGSRSVRVGLYPWRGVSGDLFFRAALLSVEGEIIDIGARHRSELSNYLSARLAGCEGQNCPPLTLVGHYAGWFWEAGVVPVS